MRAVILSGSGVTADPWHPYAETSAELAGLAREAGFDVEIVLGPIEGLAMLSDDVKVVIVNAGDPDGPQPEDAAEAIPPADELIARAVDSFDAALHRGVGILSVHSAASTLRELPAYGEALGARWIAGRSWHPPIGDARVHVVGHHEVREGLGDFTVFDERYTGMPLSGVIEPIAEHEEDGIRHPLIWARELGRSRLVYSALGHDTRSYESPEHRELVRAALRWLAKVPSPTADDLVAGPADGGAAERVAPKDGRDSQVGGDAAAPRGRGGRDDEGGAAAEQEGGV